MPQVELLPDVRWLRVGEIEDLCFDVTHLPGACNPMDPLSRLGCSDGDGPATSTGEPDAESQQKLVSRLGRDVTAPAVLAAVRARWATTRCAVAVAFKTFRGGHNPPHTIHPRGGGGRIPPGAGMFIALAGAELPLSTSTTASSSPPSDDLFLSPSLVQAVAGTVERARRRCALRADDARCSGGLGYARRPARSAGR